MPNIALIPKKKVIFKTHSQQNNAAKSTKQVAQKPHGAKHLNRHTTNTEIPKANDRAPQAAPERRLPAVISGGTVQQIAAGTPKAVLDFKREVMGKRIEWKQMLVEINKDKISAAKRREARDKIMHAIEVEDEGLPVTRLRKFLPQNAKLLDMNAPEQINGGRKISTSMQRSSIHVPPMADVPARRSSFHGSSQADKTACKDSAGEKKHKQTNAKTKVVPTRHEIPGGPSVQAPAHRGSWHGQSENDGSGVLSQKRDPPMKRDEKAEKMKLMETANKETVQVFRNFDKEVLMYGERDLRQSELRVIDQIKNHTKIEYPPLAPTLVQLLDKQRALGSKYGSQSG